MDSIRELPMGFGLALLQNPKAMQRFYELSPEKRQAMVSRTHSIHSGNEMKDFVAQLEVY